MAVWFCSCAMFLVDLVFSVLILFPLCAAPWHPHLPLLSQLPPLPLWACATHPESCLGPLWSFATPYHSYLSPIASLHCSCVPSPVVGHSLGQLLNHFFSSCPLPSAWVFSLRILSYMEMLTFFMLARIGNEEVGSQSWYQWYNLEMILDSLTYISHPLSFVTAV